MPPPKPSRRADAQPSAAPRDGDRPAATGPVPISGVGALGPLTGGNDTSRVRRSVRPHSPGARGRSRLQLCNSLWHARPPQPVRGEPFVLRAAFCSHQVPQTIADRPCCHPAAGFVTQQRRRIGKPAAHIVEKPAQYQIQTVEHRHPSRTRTRRMPRSRRPCGPRGTGEIP
jgi:hypothetical protein